jgi:nucleoside-diphosphate-sugar epimerase
MNIVIAGISGFLGGRIKKYFEAKKHNVFNYKKNCPKKIDLLINVAGPNSDYCHKNPRQSILKRQKINQKILKIVKKKKVKYFFYISTIHVYKKKLMISEHSSLNLKNPYAKSHICAEQFVLKNFTNLCEVKILRVANCFGYPVTLKSKSWILVVNNIIKNIFIKNKIIIDSKENFYRDYIGVSYLLSIINNLIFKKNKSIILNICSEKPKSALNLAQDIKETYETLFKKKINIQKKFIQRGYKNRIISKFLNKKLKLLCYKYYYSDLKELILYSSKHFI